MTQNPSEGSKPKLRLKNTDTNRFKVETGSMPVIKPPAPTPGGAETPEATQTISDPLSLRDTATGKLKRVTDTQTSASALAPSQVTPAAGEAPKTETVRLKVVRSSKPGVTLGPGAQAPARPPTPGINVGTVKFGDRAAPLPPGLKPSSRREDAVEPEATPATPTAEAPAAAPPPLAAPAPAAAKPDDSETASPAAATSQVTPPETKPRSAASSTLKINIMRPGPATAAPAAAAPAAEAPADDSVGSDVGTIKIKPVVGSGSGKPAVPSAGATVKVKPPDPSAPLPTTGKKLSLRKSSDDSAAGATQAVPAPVAPASTQAVPPPADEKKGGLKLKEDPASSSADTQAGVAPAPTPAPVLTAKTAPDASDSPVSAPAATGGVGTLEALAALAASVAIIVGAVRIIMDMMQQL